MGGLDALDISRALDALDIFGPRFQLESGLSQTVASGSSFSK